MTEWEKKILKEYCNVICQLCPKEDRKWEDCGQAEKHLATVKFELHDVIMQVCTKQAILYIEAGIQTILKERGIE